MSTTETNFTARDGIEFHIVTVEPAKPRYEVLHVHGLGEHSGRWLERFEQLAGRGARVTSFDLRGHGQSGGPRMQLETFKDFVHDVAEIAEATTAASGLPWVLYGHSMGGLIGVSYLVDQQSPVPNLAVLSAPALGDGTPAIKRSAAKILGKVAPAFTMKTPVKLEHLSSDSSVGEAYADDPLVQQIGSAGMGRNVFAEQSRLEPLVGQITVPTLVIHGADDKLVPTSASAPLAKSISVERKVYPGLRHELHFEREGARVVGDIGDWIDRKLS